MKETIKIPDSWNEVTVGQFQEIVNLDKDNKNYSRDVVSILLNKDPEDIAKYSVDTTIAINKHLEWLIKYPEETFYKQFIEIDGITYTMIENLNRFTNGEFDDMEDYISDTYVNIHLLFAMFYRPSGEEYSIAKLKERANIFSEKAMIGDVYGCLLFFSIVEKKSMQTIQDYLTYQTQTKNPLKKRKKIFKKIKNWLSGIGFLFTIHLQKET